MDHENLPCGTPALGMYASDQEMFERIWKRVMPEAREDCPIVVPAAARSEVHTAPEGEAAPPRPTAERSGLPPRSEGTESPEAPEVSELPQVPEPAEAPAAPDPQPAAADPETPPPPERSEMPDTGRSLGDDFPRQDAVPCLGSGSAGHGAQLQEDILSQLDSWQLYRHLARRVTGNAARALSTLASEKHRQARRLAAAYFLISGVRYWPTDRLATPRTATWLGTLRQRFTLEQRTESRFRTAALDTADPCLADLYRELADGCAAHAEMLRALLENAL